MGQKREIFKADPGMNGKKMGKLGYKVVAYTSMHSCSYSEMATPSVAWGLMAIQQYFCNVVSFFAKQFMHNPKAKLQTIAGYQTKIVKIRFFYGLTIFYS